MKLVWIIGGAIVCTLIALTWTLAQSPRGPTTKEFMWDKLELSQPRTG